MQRYKKIFLFIVLALAIFTDIPGKPGMCKAAGPYVVFLDDFEDGEISDWATVTSGSGNIIAEVYPGPGWSLNIYSPQTPASKAMATSPSFSLDASADYKVTMEFAFESPIHWIEVFRNQHINAVIDNQIDVNDWRFICRYDSTNYLVMIMNPSTTYNIEFEVYPGSNRYDIYVGGIRQRTCDCDPGGPAFPQFRVGDTEAGSSNYGNAFYMEVEVVDICMSAANIDNDSGHVDLGDFALICYDWLQNGPNLPGDVNGDETVDMNDLSILAYYWLGTCN